MPCHEPFSDEEKGGNVFDHNKPLFISSIIDEKEMTIVMVESASTVNILPKCTLLATELTEGHLKHSSLVK